MKAIFTTILFLCGFALQAQHQVISLDGPWNFQLDKDSIGWKSFANGLPSSRQVNVPHTWNIEKGNELYYGTAWYERNVSVPAEWKNQQVRLQFEAVYRDAVVYLNGKEIGRNFGSGYTPFSFDVTKLLKYGSDNRITVSVCNRFSEYAFPYLSHFDWPNDGGIIRPVGFVITGKPSIRYVHVKTDEINVDDNTAKAILYMKTWEPEVKKAQFTLTFSEWKSKKIILSKQLELNSENGIFTTSFNFNDIKPWHFDAPNLYNLQIDIAVNGKTTDTYTTRFGFKKLEIKGHQLFLNNEPVRLPGIEYMAGSHPDYGMAEPPEVMTQAVDLMKGLNCVITRFHWQQDYRILDMMDEKGILVQEEIPWWQAPGNLTPKQEELAQKQLDAMIERDFNHPCIFSWGISNEVYNNTQKDIYHRLIAHAKSWNSNCFVTVVSNEIFNRLKNDESFLADIPTWNEYIGTWHGKNNEELPGYMKLVNDCALQGRPLLITEHGLCEPYFTGGDTRRITEMSYHYNQWAKNDFIIGCIYFCLNDYRSKNGQSGEGRYRHWDCGLTDSWFGKKNSYEAYRGLASPVYFEYVKQSAEGTEAEVSIAVKNDLPLYTLRNYQLEWETVSGLMQKLSLPELKPGKKFHAIIQNLSLNKKPVVRVIRPTGEIAADYNNLKL